MTLPVDTMPTFEVKALLNLWTTELDKKNAAFHLLNTEISNLPLVHRSATSGEYEAAENELRGRAKQLLREILLDQKLIEGLKNRIEVKKRRAEQMSRSVYK